MSAPLWFQNLFAYCLQIVGVGLAGILLPRALRLRTPRLLYHYWQVLLVVCLLLPFVQPWRHVEAETSVTAVSQILFESDAAVTRLATFPTAWLILLVLAGGVVLRMAWLALGLAKLARFRRTARRLEPLPPGIQEMATRLGVVPEFRLSEEIQSAVTFGLRRPIVLLPPRFTELDVGRQQAIAAHELLHVSRRDWVVNLAEETVLVGFWFHPMVWWLVGRIRLSREQVVDQQVVELTGARKPYLYALVEIAAGPGAVRALAAPALLNESQLAERIRSLTKGNTMSKTRIGVVLACVTLLTLLAGLAIIRKFPLKTGGGPPPAVSNLMKAGGAPPPASNPIQAAPEIFSVGNGVTAPVPIYKPEPPYTERARRAKIQGTTILWAIIGADGTVKDVTIEKSLDPGLDQNTVNTIKTWEFKPAMKAGKPVACKVMVEVAFKLY